MSEAVKETSLVTEYKIVETQVVTDEELGRIINHWVQRGWTYDGMQLAMRDSSKRPAMAFVTFTRRVEVQQERDDDPAAPAES